MSKVAQSPSHRGEIAELFIRRAAALLLRFCCPMHILLRSVRSCYNLATTNALPRRLCYMYLDTVNICASATLPLRSRRSGQLSAWFKCSPKVGVAILDSRTTSERFHAHVIEELRAIFQLVIVPILYPSVCG